MPRRRKAPPPHIAGAPVRISGLAGLHSVEVGVAYFYRGHYLYSEAGIPIQPLPYAGENGVQMVGTTSDLVPPYEDSLVYEGEVRALRSAMAWAQHNQRPALSNYHGHREEKPTRDSRELKSGIQTIPSTTSQDVTIATPDCHPSSPHPLHVATTPTTAPTTTNVHRVPSSVRLRQIFDLHLGEGIPITWPSLTRDASVHQDVPSPMRNTHATHQKVIDPEERPNTHPRQTHTDPVPKNEVNSHEAHTVRAHGVHAHGFNTTSAKKEPIVEGQTSTRVVDTHVSGEVQEDDEDQASECPIHGIGCDGVSVLEEHRTERTRQGPGFCEEYPMIESLGRTMVDWAALLREERTKMRNLW